jgi:hypothetical protein
MTKQTDYERGYEDALKIMGDLGERKFAIDQSVRHAQPNASMDDIIKEAEKILKFISYFPKSKKASQKYQ